MEERNIGEVCVDETNKLVTSPAFMYQGKFHEIQVGLKFDTWLVSWNCFGYDVYIFAGLRDESGERTGENAQLRTVHIR